VSSAPSLRIVVQNSAATRSPSMNGAPIRTPTSSCVLVTALQYVRTPSGPSYGSSKMFARYVESSANRAAAASAFPSSQARR